MSTFIEPPARQSIPAAQRHADRMTVSFKADLDHRVDTHIKGFKAFWDSSISPDDILAAWGTNATSMLAAASESLQHIGRLAAIVGKSVDDFIPAKFYEPRRQFIPAMDGTATLAPSSFGHDAWGKFIPVPEDPQRTGYNEANEPTYGKYSDGTDIMQPLPEGGIGYTDAKEVIYGYNYETGEPILTPFAPEPTPEP